MQPQRLKNSAMRFATFHLILAIFSSISATAAEMIPTLPADRAMGYTMAWHDEFDGDKLNHNDWDIRTGDRLGSRNLAANVGVSGGMLRLAVKKEAAGPMDYTSGGVISKREFLHGYYEARMRVPSGKGWHSSFWMMKNSNGETGSRQEIDVVEHDSYNPREYGLNLHLWKPEHMVLGGTRVKTPRLDDSFHTWGCEFTPLELRYYFDGKLVFAHEAKSFTHDTQSIWLTTVGWTRLPWSKDAKIDDTKLPAFTDFEYVRFFEKTSWDQDKTVAPFPRTVIVFGDSITQGGALPKDQQSQAWVNLVQAKANGALTMINEGKGGRATAAIKEFDDMLTRRKQADILVIALGTNDSRDITNACVPQAMANVRAMIEKARKAYGANVRVVLVAPPNINKSALDPSKNIANEREQKLRELGEGFSKLAQETKCEYVTLYGQVPESTMTKDGVHPDSNGNAVIANIILQKLGE
jgi:acyl-CoA thioesterase I